MIALLAICTLCVSQAAAKPVETAPDTQQAQMSPEFSKAALRALLAMDSEPLSTVNSYINDSSVAAQTETELKAVTDLYVVSTIYVVDGYKELARRRELSAAYKEGSEHSFNWVLDHDNLLQSLLKLDSTCHSAMETSLRSRVYRPLPAECKMPERVER